MSRIDANTLKWVKSEIDETLNLAQSSLEAYVEDTADESKLRFCTNYLHQVHGTLQMVELYGAALAIDELEKLSVAISDGSVKNKDDAYETLMRGILQMPDYLEHLLAGNPEVPVVLLPLLNDIRAARNERLLSEGALFSPDLSVTAPASIASNDDDLVETAKTLRHQFHLGLLAWFKGENENAGLEKISNVINALTRAAKSDETRRVFWIANGLVESLKDQGVDNSIAVKMLIGHVDRQIKKIIDNGADALDVAPPEDLEKNLLYYIASSTSEGDSTKEIKDAFHLKEIMPDTQALAQARANLGAPNAALMETVSTVIIEDINKVIDKLDMFVRSEEKDRAVLSDVHSSLTQMSDTLAMLNLGEQQSSVLTQAEVVNKLFTSDSEVAESDLMDIAAAMIAVEKSLNDISSTAAQSAPSNKDKEVPLSEMPASEQRALLQAVLDEAKLNLAKVKNALTEFSNNSEVSDELKSVPDLLVQITGSFNILSLDSAANLLSLTRNYIVDVLINAQSTVPSDDMNNLADAISSLEYYMDSLSGEWGKPEAILDIAEQSLQALGINTNATAEAASEIVISSVDLNTDTLTIDTTSSDEAVEEDLVLEETTSDDFSLELDNEDLTAPDNISEEMLSTETVVEVDFSAQENVNKTDLLDDTIDDEIIEIFMEEADEAYQAISTLLPVWTQNIADDSALKEIRRAYHTLKGSGRLVGAADLGEFSWAFENMLNRVLDNTIAVTPELIEVMEQSNKSLPDLFELFKTNTSMGEAQLKLMQKADKLSKGDAAKKEDVDEDIAEDTEDEIKEETEQLLPPIEIDPVLLEIYRKEVATHCDSLKLYVEAWNNGATEVTNDLLRALHTLTGSSRTTHVQSLAQVCSSFENYIKHLQEIDSDFPQIALAELEETIVLIEKTVSCLDVLGAVLPEHETLLSRIEALSLYSEAAPAVTTTTSVDATTEADKVELEMPDTDAVDKNDSVNNVSATLSDYDEDLLEIFLEEAHEIIDESDNTIHNWIAQPEEEEHVKELQRQLHTLKGGARMAGIAELGDLGHSVESLLTVVVDGKMAPSKAMFDLVLLAQDSIVKMVELIQANQPLQAATDIIQSVEEMLSGKSESNDNSVFEITETNETDTDLLDETQNEFDEIELTDVTTEEDGIDEQAKSIELGAENPGAENIEETEEPLLDSETSIDANEIAISELEEIEDELRFEIEAFDANVDLEEDISADSIIAPVIEEDVTSDVENEISNDKTDTDIVTDDTTDRRQASRGQVEQVRVRADLLDNLVNFAGEVSIYRSRLEQQTNNFRYNITEFDDTVNRLREQLRQFEIETETQIEYKNEELSSAQENFDPLEMDRFTTMQHLSRAMMESLGDLDSLRGILNNLTRESETLLLQQSRVNTDLQEGLMRTRMVPFSNQVARLRRIVRQTCSELGKQAELHLEGVDSELDRTVLERIISPIEHMLRNAIAHGIEDQTARKEAGKPESGNIHFSIVNEGSDILIKITDDGSGIDLEAIRSKAIEKGLVQADEAVSEAKLLDMIMQSGFSTAESVSQISGRGVGMDVVNNEIKQLGGLFTIVTEKGKGTTFTVTLPLTLAISRALMVTVGEDTYAVPLLSVKGIERIKSKDIKAILAAENKVYNWENENYQFMHLGSVMGNSEINLADDEQQLPVLLVRSGEFRAAILVDSLLGSREIVVKSVGPQLSTLRGISGATVMGDGSVVLILDLVMLIRLMTTTDAIDTELPPLEQVTPRDADMPLVMVVDDSITVRKVTTRLLERYEMDVVSAKDGVDALSQLQEIVPDVMLLDVEMPRMDGFELATNIRNDSRLKNIPIIMITSRTGQKHRDRATSIGVNEYMGKPYTESELIESINNLLKDDFHTLDS